MIKQTIYPYIHIEENTTNHQNKSSKNKWHAFQKHNQAHNKGLNKNTATNSPDKPHERTNNIIGELPDDLYKIKRELDYAYERFNEALDPDLIDCYIFEINALTIRYNFLIKQSKGI